MKTVLSFGTFDVLHIGHIKYLKYAKSLAGENGKLIVVVSRDLNSKKLKKREPLNHEDDRLELVNSMEFIDEAKLGRKTDIFKTIKETNPDTIVLGYDQKPTDELLKKVCLKLDVNPEIVRADPYKPDYSKASKLIEKLLKYH